jgi:cysteine desulfurase
MNEKRNIFFDYNATTPLRDGVWAAMEKVAAQPLNASSIHSFGRDAKKILNDARSKIQKAFGAEGASVVFTSCGTESNNMALVCIKGVETIVTSEVEHVSISKPASFLKNILVAVDSNGQIKLQRLREVCESLKGTKFLVSIIHANNETGVIQDIKSISQIVFENGGFLHVDASQSAGKIEFDFNSLGCDMATISAHKIGGPKGAAALIVKSGLEILPMLHGGGQEKYLRAGTENIAAIVGFAEAAQLAVSKGKEEREKVKEIRDFIEFEIKKISPEAEIFGTKAERLPNTISIYLPNSTSETHLINFDLEGVAISAGSACTSGRVVTSHVLIAMGVDAEKAKSAIRISLGWNSTLNEAKQFLSIWQKIYEKNKQKKAA